MPKSTKAELAELREAVFLRDGFRCKWPECGVEWKRGFAGDTLELAHLQHRGMGGSRERNTPDNCITLCRRHHSLFDGRTHEGLHRELAALLRTLI
jgi:5-methylcytosine-specific restriction endonuclease McrA